MCNLSEIEYPILKEFLRYYKSTLGKSQKTIISYSTDLIQFHDFLKEHKNIKEFNPKVYKNVNLVDLHSFISYLDEQVNPRTNEKGISNGTKSHKQSSLKAFFKYLKQVKIIKENVTLDLNPIEINKPIPIYLSEKEATKLLKTVYNDNDNPFKERDSCMLTFLLMMGLRVSELCNIEFKHINNDTIKIYGKGRGGKPKEREVPIDALAEQKYKEYIAIRKLGKIIDEERLFLSNHGRKFNTTRDINRIVSKYIEKAQIDKQISPHKLRHTCATLLLGKNVNIRKIQALLGHESISTTQLYTHVNNADLRDAVSKNPLGKLFKE